MSAGPRLRFPSAGRGARVGAGGGRQRPPPGGEGGGAGENGELPAGPAPPRSAPQRPAAPRPFQALWDAEAQPLRSAQPGGARRGQGSGTGWCGSCGDREARVGSARRRRHRNVAKGRLRGPSPGPGPAPGPQQLRGFPGGSAPPPSVLRVLGGGVWKKQLK